LELARDVRWRVAQIPDIHVMEAELLGVHLRSPREIELETVNLPRAPSSGRPRSSPQSVHPVG